MLRSFTLAAVLAATTAFASAAPTRNVPPKDVEHRVEVLLKQMTLEEKVDLLGGVNGFDVRGVPRLGLPLLLTADGPFGVRRQARSNAMAGGIALAATWNTELAAKVGNEMGRDARARGVHFYLAPGVNIYRSPLNGRNFEYMGEDPYLAARMAVPIIQAVQAHGVSATIKHFAANNSEFLRHSTDSVVDERTLREIYLPAFEAAVKEGKVATVMNSYNEVNGEHATQNPHLNLDILKGEWGFDGVLMSDWDSTYDTLGAANAGMDIEMPSGKFFNREALLPLLRAGKIAQARLDDKVRRILRIAVRLGWLDGDQRDVSIPLYNRQGREVALQTAREGIVLLKNEGGLLPLSADKIKTLAIIGPNAYPGVPYAGGSVTVAPFRTISFLEGLSEHLPGSSVLWNRGVSDLRSAANATSFSTARTGGQQGVNVEIFDNVDLAGSPTLTRVDAHINQGAPLDFVPLATGEFDRSLIEPPRAVSMRWTGFYTPAAAGAHDVFAQFGGFGRGVGHRLYVDDQLVSDRWNMKHAAVEQLQLTLDAQPHKIVLEYRLAGGALTGNPPFVRFGIVKAGQWVDATAERMAREADVVVLAVGFDTSSELEDWDRTFALPPGQNELIRKITAANQRAIVVVTSGGAVDTNGWLERTPAMLQAWYPGQEGGTALAEILLGQVNPSGKLPATFERQASDNPVYDSYYPEPGSNRIVYREGVFVGYRGYEKNGTTPLFPFGHGLSYTTFEYRDLQIAPRNGANKRDGGALYDVTFTVANTGSRPGATVAQVYVGDKHARVARPAKELKGFAKVMLQAGESRTVSVPLDARAFMYYDVKTKQWRSDAGTFDILVGSSSAKIEAQGAVTIGAMKQ